MISALLSITDLVARLHPSLVHLPIGILLLAALFYLLSRKEKYRSLSAAVPVALFWGMICAIASAISGFLLSRTDDYDAQLVSKHQWFGIATAVVSIVAWYLSKKDHRQLKWTILLMVLLIFITGHLGGSLTHGSDYLTKAFSSQGSMIKRKAIPDVQNATVYSDIIQPILEARCYRCHGPDKQKGKLRLDGQEYILKGGEDGKIIVPDRPGESDMIERILLPKEDDDHMPPKEKPQLTQQDIDLLHWWVSNGADFTKKVNAFSQPDKIKPILFALQSGELRGELELALSDVPEKSVEKADEKILKQLIDRNVAITPVAANSNYLSANFIAVDTVQITDLKLLQSLKKQLLWLKLGDKKLSTDHLAELSDLFALTRLHLERTGLTDEALKFLSKLQHLKYLNLTGNSITLKGIEQLKDLEELTHLYIYQTEIRNADTIAMKKIFPKATIDVGGYDVPFLPADTTEVKPPAQKNK
jgi:uncharacterized membrane protein/mono/diheme cytochrome c family protein